VGRRERWRAPVAVGCLPLLTALSCLAWGRSDAWAQTPVDAGFRDYSYGTVTNTPTGDKPESKLWWNDGSWWGSLFNGSAKEYHIYRFDVSRQEWTDTGTALDTRKSSRADVLWDEASQRLYVVSHMFTTNAQPHASQSQWGRLFRYAYDRGTRRYTLESGFPVAVTRGLSEALTIAKDSAQRLWVAYVEGGKVKVNWSRASDSDWGTPIDLPAPATSTAVSADDIAAVIAFGGAYVGVMWSNQLTAETYFAFRRDTDAPAAWQPIERVVPGAGCSGACSDDHLNLKTDQQGRVYAATKTSLVNGSDPLAILSVRVGTVPGTWTSYPIGVVQNHHTRPIVLLDEENNRVYAFATLGETGGAIYMKSSPLDAISFPPGPGQPFIESATDTSINNATSTKQNVDSTTGLLVAASDQNTRYYLHGYVGPGASPSTPAAPTGLAASAVSSTRIDLAWTDASDDEDGFSIERAVSGGAFSEIATVGSGVAAYSDTTVAAATAYSYRVRASNTAGFSAYSNTASATTPGGVVTVPAAPTGLAAGVSGTSVSLSWTDASTNEEDFSIERAAGGAAFAVLVTVPANATSYSDTTVAAGTSYSYRVRAHNTAGFSGYSNTASVTIPTSPPPGGSSPIANITFEGGSLTDPATGAGKAVGTVVLETGAPLKGSYSARIPNVVSSYLEKRFTADDLYVSLYVRLNARPAASARLVQISNAGITVGSLMVTTSGRLQLRAGSTVIGESSLALEAGQLYRVGIRQKRGGGGDGVLEAYVALADGVFSGPFAATAAGTWITAADQLRVGATSPSAIDVVVDDIRLDAASMPGVSP